MSKVKSAEQINVSSRLYLRTSTTEEANEHFATRQNYENF
jgi:hypothetical protein